MYDHIITTPKFLQDSKYQPLIAGMFPIISLSTQNLAAQREE